ncbi:MAG TPA: DUF4147 domain-containing protein, partial [Syntrophales bacterium]|nr:DUF4147 domain-containing protein [Syntrophales bacterium]
MISRETLREIFDHALRSVSPESMICRDVIRSGDRLQIQGVPYSLAGFDHVHICGSGKAAARMAVSLEALLQDRLAG